MATLMAGFAFTALVQSSTLALDWHSISFQARVGTSEVRNLTTGAASSAPSYAPISDPWTFFSLLMHAGELTSVVLCLGEMLRVITEGLIARLLGNRLPGLCGGG